MKLPLDQNLSPDLVDRLSDLFPGSIHVRTVGLSDADDLQVWRFAAENQMVIATKDGDFGQLSVLRGSPPKVIWLQLGNCPTRAIEAALRAGFEEIQQFGVDDAMGTLVLG